MKQIPFAELWHCDFEFQGGRGERPSPLCMVVREKGSGQCIRMWRQELQASTAAPFNIGPDAVMIAYSAHAELSCFKALGWQFPDNVVDLYAEHLVSVNGWELPRSVLPNRGLLSAMAFRGVSGMEGARKEGMRALILERITWSEAEQKDILDYCDEDTVSSIRLLEHMIPYIDWPAALLRGRYAGALACMEWTGVPIDVDLYRRLSDNWSGLKRQLIEAVDVDYGVYDGTVFKRSKFADYLQSNKMPWPRLPSGALALDSDTFKDQARAFPALNSLRELMSTIAKLRLTDLVIGSDGRNRVFLNPYGSVTGRNQPGASEFIFGPAVWLRGLIRPSQGYGIAYCDWVCQEVAAAAALSGDKRLMEDYLSGDVYLTFAAGVGLAPVGATKATHRNVRDLCKILFLATNYGQTAHGLGMRLGIAVSEAAHLLSLNRARYPKFAEWARSTVDSALLTGTMSTKFGWKRAVRKKAAGNGRALQNWPVQSAAGDMLRIACIATTEAGISVCCPVHDALLVEGPADEIEEISVATCRLMERAGQAVTGGFAVRAECKTVQWPDRYVDERGAAVWDKAINALRELERHSTTNAEDIGGIGYISIISTNKYIGGSQQPRTPEVSQNQRDKGIAETAKLAHRRRRSRRARPSTLSPAARDAL